MKWLILLGLIAVVGIIVVSRYRRQIQMAIYVWRMFRRMRQAGGEKQIETKENTNEVPLVRCGKCGTWIPKNKALSLRSGVYYCSTKCLETTAKII